MIWPLIELIDSAELIELIELVEWIELIEWIQFLFGSGIWGVRGGVCVCVGWGVVVVALRKPQVQNT